MPSVLYDQPDVVLLCKLDPCKRISCMGHVDSIIYVISQSAWLFLRSERIAATILHPWIHHRRRRFKATVAVSQ